MLLSNFVDRVNMINKVNHKKPRLPRKTKKKYKKLGIYEDWKYVNKNNNLSK